jgi:hypothetical protein
VAKEEVLFEPARMIANEAGWLFVDDLTPLGAPVGGDRLFNSFE